MKIILHHNVGILITHVKADRGNPYCLQIDSRSPYNTYPCARKEINQKIYRCDVNLSVRSEGGTMHLYGWFHSSHYFACCGSTCLAKQAKQRKENRCKHHCIVPFQIYYSHAHSLPWQCILCYGWDLNWTYLEYKSEALQCEGTCSVNNIYITR